MYRLKELLILSVGALVVSCSAQEPEVLQPPISDNRPLRLLSVKPSRTQVPRYELIEFRLNLQATYDNAFDADEIAVDGIFTTPSGQKVRVPGFFYRDYTRKLEGRNERLAPAGAPDWRIRFAPVETGRYQMVVTVRDSTGKTVRSQPVRFTCVASRNPGFVRISKQDRRYFAFDNGQPYIPVGANVCWAGSRGTFDYDDWLPRYAQAGCNYFRVWLGPGWVTFGLERTGEPRQRYGVGKIDLANAWRLDYVLDLAQKHGMYVMLCFDSFNELRKRQDGGFPYWEETAHNAANGGPLKEPIEFWTNPQMLRAYRNKLRYLVARYGWRTNVMCWEFWNEVDIVSPSAYNLELITRWHQQMGDYLRQIDPWKHLITTSFADSNGREGIDRLPQIEFVQTHNYGSRDISAALSFFHRRKEAYGKPHFVSEFGAGAMGEDPRVDPTGIALHTGIWSNLLDGAAGTPMLWWWDNHIHPHDLYYHFAALTRFIKGVDFPREGFQRITDARFAWKDPQPQPTYTDLNLHGPTSWEPHPSNKPTTVQVSADGRVTVNEQVAGLLHGLRNHRDKHNPVTFQTDLPHPTRLRIFVTGVSGHGGAHLIVERDGTRVLDRDMPDPDDTRVTDTLNQYNGEYIVEIPAGRHTTVVRNIGNDWVFVSYILEKAVKQTEPPLRLFGLRGRKTCLLYIQHTGYTWYQVNVAKRPPEPVAPTVLRIPCEPGRYEVQFWNTVEGKVTSTMQVTADGNELKLELPRISTDIALRIQR
ncbi:MAG: DUF5060 domain-containing protein [Chthonomonadetes bacterium]|nr:DUF5060 domain-containing protein [Chthonomonadetes bacterium]